MHSFTEENYLKTIFHLSKEDGSVVTTNGIAEVVNTRAASVTDMLKKLAEKKLINYIKYQGATLTESGKQTATEIIRKHRLWEVFLVEKLDFKWDEVHDIAEELEHINSPELIERLDKFLGYPKSDPHGDPIPDSNGKILQKPFVNLNKMKPGEQGKISGVSEHSAIFLQYLEKSGLTLGTLIKIIDVMEFDGSITLEINNDKTISISREVAKNLLAVI
ncbi:metal-dependent transcriptional regulator [Daejeonella oryzae]|uniref:metal-dependent transcriptional regulator n=1 Tax=Daejeonella oryzae TaxID=1122943 RepID=UPI0004059F02|nr:metal-dependent transcriptional regulator [Daejeonella oryzae]